MKAYAPGIVATLLLCSVIPTTVRADSTLALAADTPSVSVGERSSGRNFLELPEVEFSFRIDAQCAADLQPFSLLVSVADTRKTFDANAIVAGDANEFSLLIPASQIAPVTINDFCAAEAAAERRDDARVNIPAALSAQASLRCSSESGEQTVYASTPLDVELVCEIEDQEEPD